MTVIQLAPWLMSCFALGQPEGHMVALVNAVEDIGNPVAQAFGVIPWATLRPAGYFAAGLSSIDGFELSGHPVWHEDCRAVDVAGRPPDRLESTRCGGAPD